MKKGKGKEKGGKSAHANRARTYFEGAFVILYLAESRLVWAKGRRERKDMRGGSEERRMNGLGNVIRGPVIMTPLITDNYLGYRPRGVISTGPSPAGRWRRGGGGGRRETSRSAAQFGC